MPLDVRSLREWVSDLFNRGRLSGGGPLGAPTLELAESAPDLGHESDREMAAGDPSAGFDEVPAQRGMPGRHIRE
jgi:hypothetical protein